MRERGYLEDLGVDGKRILKNGSSRSGIWGTDWIDMSQDRDR
jgi:hypothetical protein